ncbi:MAG: hypothetical protein JNL94_09980 [Planctomycetes bacterium]|nr:hypothetical protein [Planctomycetota bacterium]
MDPRNPLARILALSRSPVVARLAFVLEPFHESIARRVDVELKDGRKRIFVAPPRMSLVELLDDVGRYLAAIERTVARPPRSRPLRRGEQEAAS